MGYACPVCDAPQRDETHLANHLALQAIVHGDDHETWLDEHAPEWADLNADSLGPLVSDLAEEREFDEVFEDTVDRTGGRGHGHDHNHGHDIPDRQPQQFGGSGGSQSLSGDAARIFEEAQSLTREMYEEGEDGEETGDDEHAGRDDAGDADSADDDADRKES
ncbi:hypothetical protein C5B91_08060 [Haloferax sp. Atlit-10N]|uniref:Uncharacterized protein n=1 Tax=Haloferax prahovense (strain DSM 18310 / JCM 13924 / TL6) TaxID=1227461 RepID=M0FYY4_HALPT|nr:MULTISPECIES: DUF5810 domain-containing protein [Haloferax]ELZ65170.1 hypothetical protein C457_16752 [Haloferax prahovense DSM 18310]RDZ45047.1 hypothetical protein C5B87_12910 [Haloferax sp. Atlit-16N]RDZ48399.1 hypothetical protein C5B86_04975 [Haloferax sp. Atlit-19N]RDZ59176.1 hypothetical protein C5B91_08060 [Haloferax sp. Atlit-10N]